MYMLSYEGVNQGPVPTSREEPWILNDEVWEHILQHVLEHSSKTNQLQFDATEWWGWCDEAYCHLVPSLSP